MLSKVQDFLFSTCHFPEWLVYPKDYIKMVSNRRKFIGAIVHTCDLHPMIVTDMPNIEDVDGIRLTDGKPASCSLRHCGVYILEAGEVVDALQAWRENGERGLMKFYGYDDAAIDEFARIWRSDSLSDYQL